MIKANKNPHKLQAQWIISQCYSQIQLNKLSNYVSDVKLSRIIRCKASIQFKSCIETGITITEQIYTGTFRTSWVLDTASIFTGCNLKFQWISGDIWYLFQIAGCAMSTGEMSTEQFCLRWNDFHKTITSTFSDLRDDDEFLDVTLVSKFSLLKLKSSLLENT